MQCLKKDREQRPQSAIELRDRLVEIQSQLENVEKRQKQVYIEGLKAQQKIDLETIRNYEKELKSKNFEIEKLVESNLQLNKDKDLLSKLWKKRNDFSEKVVEGALTVELHASSHIGRIKKENEDNYLMLHVSDVKA